MASHNEHRSRIRLILISAIGVMMTNRSKRLVKKKQVKRFWRRSIFRDRKLHSEYFNIYQQLREDDREMHFKYIRMSKERFDHLLSIVRDRITKQQTNYREPISAEERLVMTLRYLSAGMSQIDLCFSFRVGRTTVSSILREVRGPKSFQNRSNGDLEEHSKRRSKQHSKQQLRTQR